MSRAAVLCAGALIALCTGCVGRYVPSTMYPYPAAVRSQQIMMAQSLDKCFDQFDVAALKGKRVAVEVTGIFLDAGGVADYIQKRVEEKLAAAGALVLEPPPAQQFRKVEPDYKVVVFARAAGVDTIVDNTLLLYSEKRLVFGADLALAMYTPDGSQYSAQTAANSDEITVYRQLWLMFYPISLPCPYRDTPGGTLMGEIGAMREQMRQTTTQKMYGQ